MYPGTIFSIEDDSAIPAIVITDTVVRPIFMAGITSDKGTEDFKFVKGSPFFSQYGSISFAKHGQPLLQAANIINSGGELYVKRIVAPDSTLANIGVVANVSKASIPATNAAGLPLYVDSTGVQTTVALGNTPVMVQQCNISYQLKTMTTADNSMTTLGNTFSVANPESHVLGTSGSYPLFVIGDVGRGSSVKKIRITPDYDTSRANQVAMYIFEVLENNVVTDTLSFTINPNIILSGVNMSLKNVVASGATQIRCDMFEQSIVDMMTNIANITGTDLTTLQYQDFLFGCDIKGVSISNINVDTTVDLRTIYGTSLLNGSDGSFGITPMKSADYVSEMVKVFDGTASDDIYDLDDTRIDVIVDANYDPLVKRAIEGLVTFREDCLYFRDLGLGLRTVAEISLADTDSLKNRYCASYHNSFDVLDPYSKKQITVTIGYSLVKPLVNQFLNGRSRPFAGMMYGVTFPEVIDGTVNFIPKITPASNQKTALEDVRINYASNYDGVLVLETLYTSQDSFTQLSFLNNVLAVQEVIKAIRARCPKIRYSFMDGDDLKKYKDDVQAVINDYVGNFQAITLVYTTDPAYPSNKIFYATITVQFRNFVQTEYFKVIAIPS